MSRKKETAAGLLYFKSGQRAKELEAAMDI